MAFHKQFQKVIDINPELAVVYKNIAGCYMNMEDKAIEYLEKVALLKTIWFV